MQMFDYVWGKVFRDVDITKNLNALKAPVFLGLGKYDFLVAPYYTWDAIVPQFKDLTVRVFEKSGPTPPFEEPELFDQTVLDWIKSHPAG